MSTTSDVQTLARAMLNDADVAAGDVFLDAVLLPFVQSAYRRLQRALSDSGVSVLIKESTLTIGANVLFISNSGTTPTLPSGFLTPHSIREKLSGSTDKFTKMNKHVDGLPDVTPAPNLRIWEWKDNSIYFVGASEIVDILLRHEQQLTNLTQAGGDATVKINGSEEALAFRTAAMAATSRGSHSAAAIFNSEYALEIDSLIRRNRKPEQRKSRRRKPYGWRGYRAQSRF